MKYFDYLRSIVYIRQMHILTNSLKSTFPISADFFPLKVLKVTRNFELSFCITNWKSFSAAPRSIDRTFDRFFNYVTGPNGVILEKKYLKFLSLETDGKVLIFSEKQTQASSIFETFILFTIFSNIFKGWFVD